jgi:hypothetical protein
MRFAKIAFRLAGIYGLIVLLPMYFSLDKTGRDFPPPVTHPEYFYGFIGVALTWQLVFLLMSTNPMRYRPIMIPAMLEKLAFFVPVMVLFLRHSVSTPILGAAAIDFGLGVLFFVSFVKTRLDAS